MKFETAESVDRSEYHKKWYEDNKPRLLALRKLRYKRNRGKELAQCAKWAKANPSKTKAANQRWRSKNAQRVKEINREYRIKNKEKLKARKAITNRIRYLSSKDAILAKNRVYAAAKKSQISAQQKKYRERPEVNQKRRRQMKAWHDKHSSCPIRKARKLEKSHLHYIANKEQLNSQHKQWRKKNPGKWRALMQKRRALEKGATINLKSIQKWMVEVKSKPFSTCYYCSNSIPSPEIHFDHIIALSKGGSHSVDNLCVSCESCNLSKSAKPIQAWVKMGQQILAL